MRTFSTDIGNGKAAGRLAAILLCGMVLAFGTPLSQAQHGHPLVGTWSGFMEREEGQPLRALATFEFSADQVISGMLIVNGQRFPFTSAVLDHENWAVTITAEGKDRAGDTLHYALTGDIENLDSPTERTLAGTWQQGENTGDFRIVIN